MKKPPGKPPSQRDDRNRTRYLATHEAGHAVSAVVLGLDCRGVDIRPVHYPDGISRGRTDSGNIRNEDIVGKGVAVIRSILVSAMAGPVAESHVNPSSGDIEKAMKRDMELATRLAAMAICKIEDLGDGNARITEEEFERNAVEIRRAIEEAKEEAESLVAKHHGVITRVAALLMKRSALTGEEVAAIVQTEP